MHAMLDILHDQAKLLTALGVLYNQVNNDMYKF